MDAQQFLKAFGHVANAPGGVAKLRELILALAVQGRLVEQDLSEEPAAAQLSRIRAKALARPSSGRRKKMNSSGPLPDGAQAENLPTGWVQARLSDLTQVLNGRAYSKSELLESGTPVLRVGNLFTSKHWYYSDLELEDEKYCDKGDLLYAWSASFGPFIWQGDRAIYHYHIWKLALFSEADLNKQFLFIWLSEKTQEIKAAGHGISMAHMTKEKFEQLVVDLPPLAEQTRIVAQVNDLMALCDKLEAQQSARRKLQNNLRQATLQAVADATSPHELQATWSSLATNFGQLFQEPEDVTALRRLLVNLAIRGLLVPPAMSKPNETIETYLAGLAKRKHGKRFAKSTSIEVDIPLPEGWRWVFLEDLLANSESGWSPKCDAEVRQNDEWGVLKVSAVTWGAFNAEENKRLPTSLEPRPEYEVKPGDFLLSRANTAELVARSVIAPENCPTKLLMSDKIVRLQFLDDRLKPWVNLVNNSDFARAYYMEKATGTSDSMRNVSRQVIHELPIPLPILEQQGEVLKALNQVLHVCGQLETQTRSRLKLHKLFSATAVAQFTGFIATPTEEPMKAPQTELIATLRLGQTPDIKAQSPLATILARHQGQMPAKDLWQRFGGEIDAFYAQLKAEVAHGWILEPAVAAVREVPDIAGA